MSKIIVSIAELARRQALPLKEKIQWTIERYIDYVEVYGVDNIFLGFSGGKDSQTLRDIIERLHNGEMMEYLHNEYLFLYNKLIKGKKPPENVFCDTGLEFPEIRANVKRFDNVVWMKPKMLWVDVVQNVGFLIGSKRVSRMIQDLMNPTDKNKNSRNLYLTGLKQDGSTSKNFKLAKIWKPLLNAPFKVSGKCCDIFKKEPFHRYHNETGKQPITATTAAEGSMRKMSYMSNGCNSFGDKPMSRPFSIWTDKDVWEYAEMFVIRFAEVYYRREVEFLENDGTLTMITVEGEDRTGCMFCLVGTPKEVEKRFDRLRLTHNKQWRFLMDGKVNIRRVLEFIGIKSKLEL